MKSKTFRLEETSIEQLKEIVVTQQITQSDAIRFAIQKGYDAIQDEIQEKDTDITQKCYQDVDWQTLYFDEKEKNEKLADKLLEVTDKVTDSLKASQILQAMDKPAIEDSMQKREHIWWQFWKH